MSSVKNTESSNATESLIWALLHTVPDPDIPVISIIDLGIVRNVEWKNEKAIITITPSYSGCPAMSVFTEDIKQVLNGAGFQSEIKTVLSPAWTTAWISKEGLEKIYKDIACFAKAENLDGHANSILRRFSDDE